MLIFLLRTGFYCCVFALLAGTIRLKAQDTRPNVIVVITDDQGYGDLGCHGNEVIKTPNLDRFYSESVHLTNFHVSPTCAPTRAALMTGRYSNRVGVWHTIAGRSQLFRDETTMAQVFAVNGYKTGIFGKWHLGDTYPFRPIDRGFHEAVTHGGGGIGQGPDYWGNDCFDDTYTHNGRYQNYQGYCTDVFFDNAIKFIADNRQRPFFLYLSTNAPHSPLHLPEKYYNIYKEEDSILEKQKRFYGMITNIDDNFKRLEEKLDELELKDNTIVIFTTDNGTAYGILPENGVNYGNDGGMRGRKGSEYEGGHRVPFFIRWPDGNIGGNKDIPALTAHIDVLPTLKELCDLHFVPARPLDGISFEPLIYDRPWPGDKRILISDSQRLQNLIKWRKSAVMDKEWRLINGKELYNIKNDPRQTVDLAGEYPEVLGRLTAGYEKWWASINEEDINERYAYIIAGTRHEDPVRINAHDMHVNDFDAMWHQAGALGGARALGLFKVEFAEAGTYQISLCRYPRESQLAFDQYVPAVEKTIERNRNIPESKPIDFSEAALYVGDFLESRKIGKGDKEVRFTVTMQEGKYDLKAILTDRQGRRYPAYYLYIDKL